MQSLSRREILVAGGIGLVAAGCGPSREKIRTERGTVKPPPHPQQPPPRAVEAAQGVEKPVYLPPEGNLDPGSWSLAENLFWTDILMEHAKFFVMLMPGDELKEPRAEAERFQAAFAKRFAEAKAAHLGDADYEPFNRDTMELVKPFIEFKHKMRDQQTSGRLRSLVWPTFFDHTAREAERFLARLQNFNRGELELDRSEAVFFWSGVMGEHADFIAHLLDPAEKDLVRKALSSAEAFHGLHEQDGPDDAQVAQAGQEILDFKTAAAQGINAGRIKSIIHPALADHVRREAAKFVDELKRLG